MPGRAFALAVATVGGIGLAPVAPGSFGSAAAIPIFVLLSYLGPWLFGVSVLTLLFLGIWAADIAERAYGRKDDGRIVIDEVVGQLIALAPLLVLGASRSASLLVTGFVLFRGFDIWKPPPARWAERRFSGGAGVVLDDVVAALFAGLALAALALIQALGSGTG